MTAKDKILNTRVQIQQFTATKQAEFFESLKQARFSGQLLMTSSKGTTWVFYLYLGRIMYATGGTHPVRRWRRNVTAYSPQMIAQFSEIGSELASIAAEQSTKISWEYKLLSLWIDEQKITREQATSLIKASVVEIIFDLTQAMQLTCEILQDNLLSTRLVLIDAEQVIGEAHRLYQGWQDAKIADRSPDLAPVIKQPEELEKRTNEKVYQNLKQLLDGNQTLRDLAVRMKRDVVTVTRSLLPYIQLGLVQLVEIQDIPPPVSTPVAEILSKSIIPQRTLVACIDDSPTICQQMEQIITGGGYQFVSESDGLRALAVLLSRKPDIIFLDLIMPNTNGYEICSQLRKLSFFRQTPIVILTGNDGIIDRVRAKMIGSTEFISKPVDPEIVIETIVKYVRQKV
jgi:two-component system, chemotaxis family, response regulator PixG